MLEVLSSDIPFLKLLMPLARSPIILEILPLPKSITTKTAIIIIAVLIVILFGKGKISSIMGDLAKGIKSFKKGMASDITDESEPKNISDENKDSENKN